jgi:TPR repeat protein
MKPEAVIKGDTMKTTVLTLLIGLMLTVGCSVATAGPFEDASAAYERAEYATALRLFRPLAEQGNAEAQLQIGEMYQQGGRLFYSPPSGEEVAQDDAEAAKWFRRAADQGHPAAQYSLGRIYEFGAGVPKNLAEAVKWYGKAADQGYAGAQYWLGTMYEEGVGVPQNDILAYKWLSLSAGLGKKIETLLPQE